MTLAPDGLVFDLDGTLWDTCALCARAWNDGARQTGVARAPLTAADMASIMGMTHAELFDALFPGVEGPVLERLAARCYELETRYLRRDGNPTYPGVAQGLRRLAERWPLFVVSNCETSYLAAFLEVSGLGPLFRGWSCHGDTGWPKGENIAALARRHGLERPLYVGDTASDARAAAEGGADFIQSRYGFGAPVAGAAGVGSFDELVVLLLGRGA